MKIAIDARKWRDYGIGTYVRNVVGHLAHLDRETTYFLFCQRSDESTLRDLAENFVPVVEDSAGYSMQEHYSIPLKLRRLGADLFHTPHYVLPLLCRPPAVVTIHDCIHLLFPQYLPNRFAWQYARFMMGSAIHRSALIFTVSEASRRDILRFYPEADPELLHVVPNAIEEAILEDPGEEETQRVKERYQIRGRFVLYAGNIKPHKNLERLIVAFGLLKQRPGNDDVKLLIIGDEVNRYGSVRHARRDLEPVVAARSGGRRGGARGSLPSRGHRPGAARGPVQPGAAGEPVGARPRARARVQLGALG